MTMWRNSKKSDVLAACFFAAVGMGVLSKGSSLGIGSPSAPEPGFFPFCGGLLLVVVSGILLFQALHERSTGNQPFANIWRPAILTVGLIGYATLLDRVGYLIATMLLSLICLQVIEIERTWWKSIVISLILTLISYALFNKLLMVQLPGGVLTPFL